MATSILAPAPWALRGTGLVILYHFPHSFVAEWGFLQAYQHKGYQGWVGAVLLMDYHSSNVGPYQELLFIPGLFKLGGRYCFSISKIYVSTEASRVNGQRNWGIPKEVADFSFSNQQGGSQYFSVSQAGNTFFEDSVKPFGPSLPFRSSLLPLSRIVQQQDHLLLLTSPEASGQLKLARLQQLTAQTDYFPSVQQLNPLAALSLSYFQMNFPVAEVVG